MAHPLHLNGNRLDLFKTQDLQFFTYFTYLTITSIAAGRFRVIPSGPTALICEI